MTSLLIQRFIVRPFLNMPITKTVWFYLTRVFYVGAEQQYTMIVASGIIFVVLAMSGALMYMNAEPADLMQRGQWYQKQGKAAEAVKIFEHLVATRPYSYQARLTLGNAYLEIDEREKAFKEFREASRLRGNNPKETGAHVAMAQMMISERRYEDAQAQLFQAIKAQPSNRKDRALQVAMANLYREWADQLMKEMEPPDYQQAYKKLAIGLKLVTYTDLQKPLIQTFSVCAERLADIYSAQKKYASAIAVLKRALKYDASVDKMVVLAALYEQTGQLDNAISWYRKVYDMETERVKLKLSELLAQKGIELAQDHQPQKAREYFEEAKSISNSVDLPTNVIYPVEIADVDAAYAVDKVQKTFKPTLTIALKNVGDRAIPYLKARASMTSGGKPLADIVLPVSESNKKPLKPTVGEFNNARTLTFHQEAPILFKSMTTSDVSIQFSVSYSKPDGKEEAWYPVKKASFVVKELETIMKQQAAARQKALNAAKAKADAAKAAAQGSGDPPEPTPVTADQ